MSIWPLLDRWEERKAVTADKLKPHEEMELGCALAFPECRQDISLEAFGEFSNKVRTKSNTFFSANEDSRIEYGRQGDIITFRSDVVTETETNNLVRARIYEAKGSRDAVIMVPHWNAGVWSYRRFSRCLAGQGLTTVEMTLPYQGARGRDGSAVADYFLSANLGRTIRSIKQAVLDTRRVIDWLYSNNYTRVAIVGVSIGSCVAGLVAAHDNRIRMSALLLTAGDFAEVVWTGRATEHIRAALSEVATLDQVRAVWSIISSGCFVKQLSRQDHKSLIISGQRDQVVRPYLTDRFVSGLKNAGGNYNWQILACGHYSMGLLPFNIITCRLVVGFLRNRD
jgi:dienelactone hydrolase